MTKKTIKAVKTKKVWVCCCSDQWLVSIKRCPNCGCAPEQSPYGDVGSNGVTPAEIGSSGAANENPISLVSGID